MVIVYWVAAGSQRRVFWSGLSIGLCLIVFALTLGCKRDGSKSEKLAHRVEAKSITSASVAESTLWIRFEIVGDEVSAPFIASYDDGVYSIHNGDSVIQVAGDLGPRSGRFQFPVLGASLSFRRDGNVIEGDWMAPVASWPNLEVRGVVSESKHPPALFDMQGQAQVSFDGEWTIELDDWGEALARFSQTKDGVITGSILPKEYGDARFLVGKVSGNKAQLSTFDGNHAFLVSMTLDESQKLSGVWHYFHVGPKTFSGRPRQAGETLQLTSIAMKKGKTKVTLPEANALEGHPVLIDFFGTWCPVCMDLTPYLKELTEKHVDKGLKVVSIAWEFDEPDDAKTRIDAYRKKYHVDWPIVVRRTSELKEVIPPEVEHAEGFPILMFLRRDGSVAGLHTGFVSDAMPVERKASMDLLRSYMDDIMSSPPSDAPRPARAR